MQCSQTLSRCDFSFYRCFGFLCLNFSRARLTEFVLLILEIFALLIFLVYQIVILNLYPKPVFGLVLFLQRSRFDQEQYDQEEVVRNSHRKGNMSGTTADVHSYQFERSGSRRNWDEILRSYGNSQPRGSERSRSNRYS